MNKLSLVPPIPPPIPDDARPKPTPVNETVSCADATAHLSAAHVAVPIPIAVPAVGSGREDTPRLSTCYAIAVALDAITVRIGALAGKKVAWLAEHATRGSAAVVLHLAESVGAADDVRPQHIACARAAVLECDSALTLLQHRGACPAKLREQTRELTRRLIELLSHF